MRRLRQTQGFTLIELLIAVLVVGILAAIALPAFNKQRERAKDSAAQQRLEAGLRAAKAVYAEGESFPSSGLAAIFARAERSQGFADSTAFPAAGAATINVDRPSANRVVLRTTSASGNQHMLSLDEPDSRVYRSGPAATSASGSLTAYTNLVPNPSLETDASFWSYGVNAGSPQPNTVTMTSSTAWSAYGGSSLRMTAVFPGGGSQSAYYNPIRTASGTPSTAILVSPSTDYAARMRLRVVSLPSGGACRLSLVPNNSTPSFITPESDSASMSEPGERTLEAQINTPATTAGLSVRVRCSASGSGNLEAYVDGVQLVQTSQRVPGYVDGSMPGASWSGTAHASASSGPAAAASWND